MSYWPAGEGKLESSKTFIMTSALKDYVCQLSQLCTVYEVAIPLALHRVVQKATYCSINLIDAYNYTKCEKNLTNSFNVMIRKDLHMNLLKDFLRCIENMWFLAHYVQTTDTSLSLAGLMIDHVFESRS